MVNVYPQTRGGVIYSGHFVHHSGDFAINIGGLSLEHAWLEYNYLLDFMDIDKPLADIPEHELTRHCDPVTAAHDRENKRNPRYWRDQSDSAWFKAQELANKRVYMQMQTQLEAMSLQE